MNPARIELQLVLKQAGLENINLNTFSQRFNIQKRLYLIQLMGNDLGYRFGWYIRGPYSRDLTADAFTLRDEIAAGDKDSDNYTLSDQTVQQVEKAKALWATPSQLPISNDNWLELLASLHYLKHIAYWPKEATRDFEAVFKKLIESKPQFMDSKGVAQMAWNRLKDFGLISAKTLA